MISKYILLHRASYNKENTRDHFLTRRRSNSVLCVFVLMGWWLLPNALRPFHIYCAPPNFSCYKDVNMPIKYCSGAYLFQAWGSLTSLKSQTRYPQLKVPPGGLLLRSFTSWKNPSTSAKFETMNLGSQGKHVTPRPPRLTIIIIIIIITVH